MIPAFQIGGPVLGCEPMKVDLGIWDSLHRLVVVLLIAAAVAGLVRWYLPEIQENERLRLTIYEKQQHIAQLAEDCVRIKEDVLSARRDRAQVERWIRESLGWGRPNETIIKFVEPAPVPETLP